MIGHRVDVPHDLDAISTGEMFTPGSRPANGMNHTSGPGLG
jgi:hypothetical protein